MSVLLKPILCEHFESVMFYGTCGRPALAPHQQNAHLGTPFATKPKIGRGGRTRTCGLLVPNQARYQASLRPD